MQINDVLNRDELSALVIKELRELGIKYKKEKKCKAVQETTNRKRIFRTHLHLLELTDVILANGQCVQIPKIIADACNRILENVEVEGIFRKAGSSIRQREIRENLEAGFKLRKMNHVVDIANVIKSFMRELPEPLIPTAIHGTLLRSLVLVGNNLKAMLLTCLLLPSLTINTLSFFMQFLYTVSLSSNSNKMTIENLAIIFSPGLMPCTNINNHNFGNHIKIVKILIENANAIGKIPDCIFQKLQLHELASQTSPTKYLNNMDVAIEKKKKKRRSDVFNGIKKIVGSALGSSSENLLNSMGTRKSVLDELQQHQITEQSSSTGTRCTKYKKNRKTIDPVGDFSVKKKRNVFIPFSSNIGGLSQSFKVKKTPKNSRSSFGGSQNDTDDILVNPIIASMERRWSVAGSGWSGTKKRNINVKKTFEYGEKVIESKPIFNENSFFHEVSITQADNLTTVENKIFEDKICENHEVITYCESNSFDVNLIPILKMEYGEIKERVAAIETRISQEFKHLMNEGQSPILVLSPGKNRPEYVQNKYEKIIEESEILLSNRTDEFTNHLHRDLKLRQRIGRIVIRSPSARKIRTMRHRSQEKTRLSRNSTWRISLSTVNNAVASSDKQLNSLYTKCANLKRGHSNSLYADLTQQQCSVADKAFDVGALVTASEKWISGELFFNGKERNTKMESVKIYDKTSRLLPKPHVQYDTKITPGNNNKSQTISSKDNITTPMLSRSASRRLYDLSTPNHEELNGRESIARLRAQNVGMVKAKARLFDDLGGSCSTDNDDVLNIGRNISRKNTTPSAEVTRKHDTTGLLNLPDTTLVEASFSRQSVSINDNMDNIIAFK